MKLRFSLATLLICMTVLAMVFAACLWVKVPERTVRSGSRYADTWRVIVYPEHSPRIDEAAWRIAWSAPLAIAATLAALWTIRR